MIEFNNKKYYTATELSEIIKINRRAIMRLVKLNLIKYIQPSPRKFYFSEEIIEEYFKVKKFLE